MHFHILTLFPEMTAQCLNTSIIGRAVQNGFLSIDTVNIRDYTADKHKKVDDYPYGGGAGMLMQAQPVYDAWRAVVDQIHHTNNSVSGTDNGNHTDAANHADAADHADAANHADAADNVGRTSYGGTDGYRPRTIYLTPQAPVFSQQMAEELAGEEHLILLCGHYEGIDERVLEEIVTDYISIGDYILTGGELPAMVVADAVARMVPGVLSNAQSGRTESLEGNLLEYPQYSRPEEWNGKKVPPVLLSGDHAKVDAWRREQSILRTIERRPDLLERSDLTEAEWEKYGKLG